LTSCAGTCDIYEGLRGLSSEKLEIRQEGAAKIRERYKQTVQELTKLAAEEARPLPSERAEDVTYPWSDSKHLAMLLLGDLRAAEAVSVLLENLEYRNPKRLSGSYLFEADFFPAAEALVRIGIPAVDPVIERLGGYQESCLGRRLCLVVLRQVLGTELAQARLEIAIEAAKHDTSGRNLASALAELKAQGDRPFDV